MDIAGLQKLTLLDYPGHTACTVFLKGCGFRCPFCHNALLVLPGESTPMMAEEDFFAFLQKRRGLLDGVCITGGEPTLYPTLPNFIKKIRKMGFAVKLDTNGSNPAMLSSLLDQQLLDYVAMDIKATPEKYARAVGIPDFDLSPITKSISILEEGRVDYEFRTTVVRELHEINDFHVLGKWLHKAPRYFLQAFIDSGHLIGSGLSACSKEEMEAMQNIAKQYISHVELRGIS